MNKCKACETLPESWTCPKCNRTGPEIRDERVYSGSWTRHADYPHWPGTLYGCLACETECFCDQQQEGFMCIACDTMLRAFGEGMA